MKSEESKLSQTQKVNPDSSQSSGAGEAFFTLHSSLLTPLMTCRFCLRHAWGWCKKENPNAPRDPLFLVLGDGRKFRLEFDCKKCEMMVLAQPNSK